MNKGGRLGIGGMGQMDGEGGKILGESIDGNVMHWDTANDAAFM